VIEREHDRSSAFDNKECDQQQCERERASQGRRQQHAADDKGENGRN
jgi:hypothetical protein